MPQNSVPTGHREEATASMNTYLGAPANMMHPSPAANRCFKGPVGKFEDLRKPFQANSSTLSFLHSTGVSQRFQSVPASCSTSPVPSQPSSRSSSRQSSPSASRQQSFTFTPPSWHDSSFVSFKPTEAVPRLERTTSSPTLPHNIFLPEDDCIEPESNGDFHEVPFNGDSTPAAFQPEIVISLLRQPSITGWAEIESTKVTILPSGRKLYRCTYCNAPLNKVKNYIVLWAKVLFCQQCKNIPQCNSCYKKAVPFIYVNANGIRKMMQPVHNFGGLNICGQCVLINPFFDPSTILRLVRRSREFLQTIFAVKFTEQLLAPHTEPEVVACLEALRLTGDSQGASTVKINPTTYATKPRVLRKNSSGEVAELPFDVDPVWHIQLCQQNSQSVYGQCVSRTLTFPPRELSPGRKDNNQNDTSPRTYRVVQRIMLSRGIAESLIYGHLVHELLHAFIWLFLDNNSVKIDLAAEEGLCNCVLAAALQMRVETLQARRKATIDALLRRGVHPKTDPSIKEIRGIPQAAEFLKAIIEMGSKPDTNKNQQADEELHDETQQSCAHLEHHLYVTEYELKVLNRRLGEMERDLDPVYGVGYRTIREIARRLTVVRLIEILGRHGETLKSVVNYSMINQGMPPATAV